MPIVKYNQHDIKQWYVKKICYDITLGRIRDILSLKCIYIIVYHKNIIGIKQELINKTF